ncbi:Gfo/Idh/MocA family protein [Halovenus marina]|uniref:Gfo/Idh/MocA family protein n=1 Tax=Halovenus marina TaxID=3396621 RepID=UPI003F55DA6A
MTYTTGLLGTGFVSASHAEGYAQSDDIDLVAIADIDEEQLAEFGDEWSIPKSSRYTDHHEMIAAEDLDALSVTTPSFLHHDHVLDAAQAGNAPDVIWCEKPIALNVADAQEMLDACAEADIELVINHMRRFSDSYTALRELIADGFLGDLDSVTTQFPRELLRNGTHTLDLIYYLLGETGESVTGTLTGEHGMPDHVEDAAPEAYDDCGGSGTVNLTDGTYVSLDHTSPRAHSATSFHLVGSEGRLHIDDGGEWTYWKQEETDTQYGKSVKSPLPDPLTVEDRDLFATGAQHIADLLDGSVENRSPGAEATAVLEMLIAMFVSDHTGARVSLPLSGPLRTTEVFSW